MYSKLCELDKIHTPESISKFHIFKGNNLYIPLMNINLLEYISFKGVKIPEDHYLNQGILCFYRTDSIIFEYGKIPEESYSMYKCIGGTNKDTGEGEEYWVSSISSAIMVDEAKLKSRHNSFDITIHEQEEFFEKSFNWIVSQTKIVKA